LGNIFLIKKNNLFSNFTATILSAFLVCKKDEIAIKFTAPNPETVSNLVFFAIEGLLIIYIIHYEHLKNLFMIKKYSG
jgi:hypothetical protein